MESSESDTENECFESAEESLGENDELEYKKIKSKKSLCKSESEVAKPVVSNCDTVDALGQVEENHTNNLLSYRKRPERVKRIKPSKHDPKSFPNEVKLHPDKIMPDVFFQDITSNLSKNINRSLNSLHQTSSNVKDLILSSLPMTSVSDNETFAYDDKNYSSMLTTEGELTNTEANCEIKTQFESIQSTTTNSNEIKEKKFDENVNFLPAEGNSVVKDKINNCGTVGKPVDINTDSTEKENCKFNDCIFDSTGENKMNTCVEQYVVNNDKADKSSDMENKGIEDDCKQEIKNMPENRSEQLDFQTYSDYLNMEKVVCQEYSKEFSETDFIEVLPKKNEQTVKSDDIIELSSESNKTPLIFEEVLDSLQEKQAKQKVSDELNLDENYLIFSKDTINNECLTGNNGENFTDLSKDKNETNLDCNLEELKLALKNIVQEKEKSCSENISEGLENKLSTMDFNLEEGVNTHENSNDGWDDFDFSDDEIENVNQRSRNKCTEKEDEDLNKELQNNEPKNNRSIDSNEEVKVSSSSKNFKTKPVSAKEYSTEVKNMNIYIKKANDFKEKNQKEIKNEMKQLMETKQMPDNSWDWDNWNENSEDDEEKVESKPSGKDKSKLKVDDFYDVSKWSGWDNFGQKPSEKQGNWTLGSWGVDALLNKATAVTQGISNVLEAGLGAPDPETLARLEKQEREKLKKLRNEEMEINNRESSDESSKGHLITNVSLFPVSGITSLVAGVTSKIVEHSKIQEIGSKVITGGLDTLETLGKKTMEVLQEGDPGLKNKSALLLGNNKPILSQVLREAREKAEKEIKEAEEKELAKKCHFETLFDDFQGMVHLEALEMLSRQCQLKLDQIKSGMNSEELEDLNGVLEEVEQLCSLDDYDTDMKSSVVDFKTALQIAVEPLKDEISIQRIIQIDDDANKWLKMASATDFSVIIINQKLVSTLAELAAATVHQFHKSGELLSVKECRKTVEEIDALSRLTNVLCKEINRLCNEFVLLPHKTNCANENFNYFNEKVSTVMQNSTLYIRQAFDLLIPVIQLGAAV